MSGEKIPNIIKVHNQGKNIVLLTSVYWADCVVRDQYSKKTHHHFWAELCK